MVAGGPEGEAGLRRTPKTLARCMSASRARTAPVRKSDAIAVGITRRRPPPSSAPREVTVACENLDGRYDSYSRDEGVDFLECHSRSVDGLSLRGTSEMPKRAATAKSHGARASAVRPDRRTQRPMFLDEFEFVKRLGEGAFATVWAARRDDPGRPTTANSTPSSTSSRRTTARQGKACWAPPSFAR